MLIAESYLMNDRQTKLESLDLHEERERIFPFLEKLLENDCAPYIPRPLSPLYIIAQFNSRTNELPTSDNPKIKVLQLKQF
jgi:hypothetical protein